MFNNYDNKNFHLDFWESCENGTAFINRDIPEGFNKTLARLNSITERFQFEGKWYDSLEDVYHTGTAKEFSDTQSFLKYTNPQYIKNNYRSDSKFPVDFFIQFIDPKTLKRIAFMVVYEKQPFETSSVYGGEKPNCRLILYKGKAYAVEKTDTKHKFAFAIKTLADAKRAYDGAGLRIVWHEEPRKTLDKLKPSEVHRELIMGVSKLNSSGYWVIDSNDDEGFDKAMERILNATR